MRAPLTLGLGVTPLLEVLDLFAPSTRIIVHEFFDTLHPDAPVIDEAWMGEETSPAELRARGYDFAGTIVFDATIDGLRVGLAKTGWRFVGEPDRVMRLHAIAKARFPETPSWIERG